MVVTRAIGRAVARTLAAVAVASALATPTTALAPAASATTPGLCAATPFRANTAAHVFYRIPALVTTTAGTLLAFAERRDSDAPSSDTGDTSIVVARSTDRGCTWSDPKVIADHGTDTVGNPAPVVDTTTGRILLFSIDRVQGGSSYHGLHMQTSTDDGRTFTAYADSADDLAPSLRNSGWQGGLTGPGHAVQIQTGAHAGRIIVPITYYLNGEDGAYGIVSDDHGSSWHIGYDEAAADGRMEGTIAALPDGRLWIEYRQHDQSTPITRSHLAAFSADGGDSLTAPFASAGTPHTVAVQGSALALTGTHAGTLLSSSPTDPDRSARRDLGIFVSSGSAVGTTWSEPYAVRLEDTPASYSDLTQIDDATIGVLFETGTRSWHEGISFRSLAITSVLAGAKVAGSLTATVPSLRLPAGGELHVHLRAKAPGTTAPAGTFRVRLSKWGTSKSSLSTSAWSRSVTLPLVATNGGTRVAVFTGLPRGRYTLHVQYVGTSRIRGATVPDRVVTVG